METAKSARMVPEPLPSVGGAHQLAVLGDGVLAFQNLNDDRTGSHEGNQILKKPRSLCSA